MEFWQEAEVCLHCTKEQRRKIQQGNEVQAWLDKHWKVRAFQAAVAEKPSTEKPTRKMES